MFVVGKVRLQLLRHQVTSGQISTCGYDSVERPLALFSLVL